MYRRGLRGIRICRPRYAYGYRACGTIHQTPAPEQPSRQAPPSSRVSWFQSIAITGSFTRQKPDLRPARRQAKSIDVGEPGRRCLWSLERLAATFAEPGAFDAVFHCCCSSQRSPFEPSKISLNVSCLARPDAYSASASLGCAIGIGALANSSRVRQLARDTASKAFMAPDSKLPELQGPRLRPLPRDRFLPERALWRSEKLPFEIQFFHRGFFSRTGHIYEVVNGQATKIEYQPDYFSFGETNPPHQARISALPAFESTRRSTGPIITTRSAFSSVQVISAPSQRARSTACRLAASPSIPVRPKAKNFRSSRHSGSKSLHPTQPRSSCMLCSTVKAPPRPIASPSARRATTVFDVEMSLYPRVDLDQPD